MAATWEEFEAALTGFLEVQIEQFAVRYPEEVAYEFLVHCNAYYGGVFCYLKTRLQNYGEPGVVRYPNFPDHPPREPEGLDYTLGDGEDGFDLNDEIEENLDKDPRVDRWMADERQSATADDDDRMKFVEEFLERACRVALRLERSGAFNILCREPSFVLFVQDHDESNVDSWKRLFRARIELMPPWQNPAWPIGGRHPDIANVLFAMAADHHSRDEVRKGSYLLREAIARLPELDGPPTFTVTGSDVKLSVPENEAWARAFLAQTTELLWTDRVLAMQLLERAAQLAPNLAEVHYTRANIRSGPIPAKELDQSVADLDIAIQLDPSQVEFYALRAELRARPYYPFWDQALLDYTKAHELDPDNQKWLMRRAEVLTELRQHEAAIADYSQVFKLRNSELTWYVRNAIVGRATCLQELHRYQEAMDDWNRLIDYEESPRYFRGRAVCRRGMNDEAGATADDEKAAILERPKAR